MSERASPLKHNPNQHNRALEFENNRYLPELYGTHGCNLARIEQILGVVITTRGNQLFVVGDERESERACVVLRALYQRLASGAVIEAGDVDGALRLAMGDEEEAGEEEPRARETSLQQTTLRTKKRDILARSPTQAAYIEALGACELVFGLGPAGTGKTYLAVAAAASMLQAGAVERIILSRPAIEAGERLGFLPGDMREKIDPYLRPLYDALYDMLPNGQVERALVSGAIEIAPLAFMRGRTLKGAFVILDEAQNATPVQMKMFLTRLGEGSHMVVNGDPSQVDLPAGQISGLRDAVEVLEQLAQKQKEKNIKIIRFGERDVVRHDLVAKIIAAYEKRDRAKR